MAVVSTTQAAPNYDRIQVTVNEVVLNIATIHQILPDKPVVLFLHGFGGTKEDYADFLNIPTLTTKYSFFAFDAPGCGETECASGDERALLDQLSIPFLVAVAESVLSSLGIERFHLVGHSMGGLTALLLAHKVQHKILSFIDIKGNLASEDCFLSRQVLDYPADDPELFFNDFVLRTSRSKSLGSTLYAVSLRHKIRAPQGEVTSAIFRSMVQLSDQEDLLGMFLNLHDGHLRRMFMFGEENRNLSYLPVLKAHGVKLAEVVKSGHFVMYSNPPSMWRYIEEFLKTCT